MGAISSARLAIRLALRELRNDPRFALFFAINLALGLSGFVVLDALESSVASELQARSKTFLGADIAVSSNRPLTTDERRAVDEAARPESTSDWVELFSMASGARPTAGAGFEGRRSAIAGRARLVEIRAIEHSNDGIQRPDPAKSHIAPTHRFGPGQLLQCIHENSG